MDQQFTIIGNGLHAQYPDVIPVRLKKEHYVYKRCELQCEGILWDVKDQ